MTVLKLVMYRLCLKQDRKTSLIMLALTLQQYKMVSSFQTNMHQGSGIDPVLITILAFLVKDSPEKL